MITKICALLLVSSILGALLSELGFKSKRIFTVLCMVLAFISLADNLSGIISEIMKITDAAGISDAAKCAVKAVGIGYVFGFASEICAELGESRIATLLTLVGRIETFVVVLPYFEKTVGLGMELLK